MKFRQILGPVQILYLLFIISKQKLILQQVITNGLQAFIWRLNITTQNRNFRRCIVTINKINILLEVNLPIPYSHLKAQFQTCVTNLIKYLSRRTATKLYIKTGTHFLHNSIRHKTHTYPTDLKSNTEETARSHTLSNSIFITKI